MSARANPPISSQDREGFRELHTEGWSVAEIAAHFGCSKRAVRYALRGHRRSAGGRRELDFEPGAPPA